MSARDQILSRLKLLKDSLFLRYPISALALFGSIAREDDSEQSDIDILVEINGSIGSKFIDLADEIEAALGRKVDLVSRNAIKPKYYNSIKHDLIYV